MQHSTVIAADIAKHSFQCARFSHGRVLKDNLKINRHRFESLIQSDRPMTLIMESCSGAQHWARLAKANGHEAILVPPKAVAAVRQGHKTDANDALAIFDVANSVNFKPAVQKDLDTQALQSLMNIRRHYQEEKTRLNNVLRGHLSEYGLVFAKGQAALKRAIPSILEEAENGLPHCLRDPIHRLWQDWIRADQHVSELTQQLMHRLNALAVARDLMTLPGVGPVNAAGLLCALGDGQAFTKGRQAAAFVGTAPKQHSTGGKVTQTGIDRRGGHSVLRANLVQGAWSVLLRINARGPVSDTERWLGALSERRGERKAVIAMANKTVRRAWAIINRHHRTDHS